MRTRTRPLTSFLGCHADVRGSGPLLALTTAAAFAASTIALKYVSEALDPSSIILLRSLVALVVLATLAAPQGAAALRVSLRHLLPIALMGVSGIVGYVYFL
ncbi:MAG: EamA family transporter, partial [Candidatus Binatia bacterium]